MKKLFLLVVLAVSFTACSSTTTEPTTAPAVDSSSVTVDSCVTSPASVDTTATDSSSVK